MTALRLCNPWTNIWSSTYEPQVMHSSKTKKRKRDDVMDLETEIKQSVPEKKKLKLSSIRKDSVNDITLQQYDYIKKQQWRHQQQKIQMLKKNEEKKTQEVKENSFYVQQNDQLYKLHLQKLQRNFSKFLVLQNNKR
jgi:hypothetical protein